MSDSELPPVTDHDAAAASSTLGVSWQSQDGVLTDLWRQNKTPQEISAVLGRSVGAIMTRAARLGLPRRSAPGRKAGSRNIKDIQDTKNVSARARAPLSRKSGDLSEEGSVSQTSTRVCLMCLRSFQSMGRHNRICPSCKGSAEYAVAAQTADIHLPT